MKTCVCGNFQLQAFSDGYLRCEQCQTLIARRPFDSSISQVVDEENALYGQQYWYSHQAEYGYPDIETRAREDLFERCAFWLRAFLKYKRPPGRVLELGCAHGGFVALLNSAGFDATGLELSESIAQFARTTFQIPVLSGTLEDQDLPESAFDAIAMLDVLEHLPEPRRTIVRCMQLLKPDGILFIQTPLYPAGTTYDDLVSAKSSFVVQLKDNEHLFLFSAESLDRFLESCGARQVLREPAIFSHYDQFAIAAKDEHTTVSDAGAWAITPSQRLVQAILDSREQSEEMYERWQTAEEDRRARLQVIEDMSRQLVDLQTSKRTADKSGGEFASGGAGGIGIDAESLAAMRAENAALKESIRSFQESLTGRVLNAIQIPIAAIRGRSGGAFSSAQPWLPTGRKLETYALRDFLREFSEARPDLKDVRGYNRQMVDILADLKSMSNKVLLDVGASPHGFALERALELKAAGYCGIGLGIERDLMIRSGNRTALLLRMNADEIALPPESFDLIITLSTFEHFFHPDLVLRQMHKVLKTGGAMLVNFQPIWTSLRGHHLHHIPDVCPLLPPWSHLRWTKDRMLRELGPTWPAGASMSINQVTEWIYDSDEINRLPAAVLHQAFQDSPFRIEWITPMKDQWTGEEAAMANQVANTTGHSVEELGIQGFSAMLVK